MTAESRAADAAHSPPPVKSVFRDYAETILICVIFVVFSRAFVFQQSKIPSGSMEDTLLIGDYIMVNRFIYARPATGIEKALLPMREVRRGDVVVFKKPDQPETDFIKRVIGLPGDRIRIRNRTVYVNDEPIDEPYVEERYRRGNFDAEYSVPPENYFMMGDHRDNSNDSRSWGPVHRDLIKGRALLVWWSFDECYGQDETTCRQPAVFNVPAGERVRSWGLKLRYFFQYTRWERCFRLIR